MRTNTERTHLFRDRAASIDEDLDEALKQIDWKRRKHALKSLNNFIETYCVGIVLNKKPSDPAKQALKELEKALRKSKNYMQCYHRGAGKTSFSICAIMYAILSGLRNYCVIISANASQAKDILANTFRLISEPDTAIAQDFPEAILPLQLCAGSYRRRQTYRGRLTEIVKNNSVLQFPRIFDDNDKEYSTSGSIIMTKGLSGGLRGMLGLGGKRPNLIIIDDPQTTESANSQEQVQKIIDIIQKDIMSLGGSQKPTIITCATPITNDDVVEKIRNDKNWRTSLFPCIISRPKNKELWGEYFRLYDDESIDNIDHSNSLKFYKEHFSEMNEGAEVFSNRFSKSDGHISALQKFLILEHEIGESNFSAEYQMEVKKQNTIINITPNILSHSINSHQELTVPDGCVATFGALDINSSYGITVGIASFKMDTTSYVIYHNVFPCRIDQKLNEQQYSQELHKVLVNVMTQIAKLGIKIDGFGMDAGGRNFDIVCNAVKTIRVGIPIVAMVGRSSNQFNPLVRTRLRNAVGETVLVGDAQEQIKSGSGKKWLFWNADFYKEVSQKSLISPPESIGSCSVYQGDNREHAEFFIQVSNEKLKFKIERSGRFLYGWKDNGIHDYGDVMAELQALAQSQNIMPTIGSNQSRPQKPVKRRIRLV